MSVFSKEQIESLRGPMPRSLVAKHPHSKKDYIKGWQAEAVLNTIFGPDGWETHVHSLERVSLDLGESKKGKPQWTAVYTCVASLTAHGDGASRTHTGVGAGSGFSALVGDAVDSAAKEAATDALKRAAKRFGWPLGLACYDQTGRHYADEGAGLLARKKKAATPRMYTDDEDAAGLPRGGSDD